MGENLPDTNVGNIEYICKQAAIDAFGLSEKTRKYGGDHSGYDTRMLYEIQDTIESLEPADVVSKNDIAVLLDETVKELTSGRKNPIADSFIVSVIGIVKCKIMMMGEE